MNPPADLFRDAKLKIIWANEHITHMNALIGRFVQTDFCSLSVEEDPNTGDNRLKFGLREPIPPVIALHIGDSIHNLRASLDYVQWEICGRANLRQDRHTRFAVSESREKLIATVNGGSVKTSLPQLAGFIIDVIQPYQGGKGDPLYTLHHLDIADKHRLLVPVLSVVALNGVNAIDENGNRLIDCSFSVTGGPGQMTFIRSPRKIHIKSYGKATFDVLFGDGEEVVRSQPVFPTLVQLSQFVSGVVDQLAQQFAAVTTATS